MPRHSWSQADRLDPVVVAGPCFRAKQFGQCCEGKEASNRASRFLFRASWALITARLARNFAHPPIPETGERVNEKSADDEVSARKVMGPL